MLVAATWIPGSLGGILHFAPLELWGIGGGYIGASWAMPASLVGLATRRWARDEGAPRPAVWGWVVGSATAVILLIGAGACIGS
jgi:hypothetical protein